MIRMPAQISIRMAKLPKFFFCKESFFCQHDIQRHAAMPFAQDETIALIPTWIGSAVVHDIIKQHGIKVGNAMLSHFALMTNDRRRNEDVLARTSYKEFRMLLPGVDEEGSRVVIKKIENAVLGEEYVYRGNSLKAEFLVSAITKREEDLHLQQMLQEGEVELYRMKQKPETPA